MVYWCVLGIEAERCEAAQYGCCQDQKTMAKGPNGEGCPSTFV